MTITCGVGCSACGGAAAGVGPDVGADDCASVPLGVGGGVGVTDRPLCCGPITSADLRATVCVSITTPQGNYGWYIGIGDGSGDIAPHYGGVSDQSGNLHEAFEANGNECTVCTDIPIPGALKCHLTPGDNTISW